MSTEIHNRVEMETLGQSALGHGRLIRGKWYCECDIAARCITTKKSGPNNGRKIWRCPNVGDKQCAFFLWVDQDAEARDWLKKSQPPLPPQTPTRRGIYGDGPNSSPQLQETPFTIAKRKQVSRDPAKDNDNDNDNDDYGSHYTIADRDPLKPILGTGVRESSEQARKAARTSDISTPGQQFIDRLQSSTLTLPTPDSRDRKPSINSVVSQQRLLQQLDTSPTPGRFIQMAAVSPSGASDLATAVVEIVRADHPKLKVSTEMLLRHEIGLKLDVDETKLRRYEGTISELRKRVDELETMIDHLT